MASLEDEINHTWDMRDLGVPLYVRGGKLEVDPPVLDTPAADATRGDRQMPMTLAQPISDLLAAGQGPTYGGDLATKSLTDMTPVEIMHPQVLQRMGGALAEGVAQVGRALVSGGVKSVGDVVDDVALYASQGLNPVAAAKAQPAPQAVQDIWRDDSVSLENRLRIIEGMSKESGNIYLLRRSEGGQLEPIVATPDMLDGALTRIGRVVSALTVTNAVGGAAETATKAASRGRTATKGAKEAAGASSGLNGEDRPR